MRISDWSSDVCSSDLGRAPDLGTGLFVGVAPGVEVRAHRSSFSSSVRGSMSASPRSALMRSTSRAFALSPSITVAVRGMPARRSEEHTSELQSLMRISYAVFCLKKKKKYNIHNTTNKLIVASTIAHTLKP